MYSVKHASALTGVPVDTLRMWERRYRVVEPRRTESGYRVYDDVAIARLTAMRALVQAGWAPRLAALEVVAGPSPAAAEALGVVGEGDPAVRHDPDVDLLVRLAADLDGEILNRELDRVFREREFEVLVDSWLMPALAQLGDSWRRGEISVASEHFVSAGVQRRLSAALDAGTAARNAPRLLVGLARGSRHELGVLAFAAVLARAGFNVGYVGGDVPPEGWVVAATTGEPAAVVLGVPNLEDVAPIRDVVAALAAVRPDLPVLLGGGHQERIGAGEVLGHSLTRACDRLQVRLMGPGHWLSCLVLRVA